MAYEFSFDGKSLWAFGGGSVVLCLLLFLAGVLLGANWGPPPQSAAAGSQPTPDTRPAPAQPAAPAREAAVTDAAPTTAALPYATAPQQPAFYGPPPTQQEAARWYGPQDYAAQGYAAARQGYGREAAAPADYAAQPRHAAPAAAEREESPAPPVNAAREAARLNSSGANGDPRLVSEAEAIAPEASAQGASAFAVQVGAYADEPEARRLLATLENKGYTPSLLRGRDVNGRQWFAVRIGSYASQREATQAAQNFTRHERMQAAVRPSGSL